MAYPDDYLKQLRRSVDELLSQWVAAANEKEKESLSALILTKQNEIVAYLYYETDNIIKKERGSDSNLIYMSRISFSGITKQLQPNYFTPETLPILPLYIFFQLINDRSFKRPLSSCINSYHLLFYLHPFIR